MSNQKILCVDDDEKILNGIQRQQGDDFDISTALGPFEALEMVDSEGPYAIVISDMRMPEMNGVELLKRVREKNPNTIRMILTGFAELNSTIDAVNQGHIFRFLAKPCSTEDLSSSFSAGLRQYALIEAETELVEGTLHGSVKVLSEVLSLVNPLAFGQSTRVRATIDGILKRMPIENQWQIEIAAMLSALGCVTLPVELLQKHFEGESLSKLETEIFSGHPAVAGELLRSIPRLERVADIIEYQDVPLTENVIDDREVPLESRILKLAIDFDLRELNAESSLHALSNLKQGPAKYNDDILDALSDYVKTERNVKISSLMLDELCEGMVLAEDVKDAKGTLLMSKGQEISASAHRLLKNFSKQKVILQPIKVVVSNQVAEPAAL